MQDRRLTDAGGDPDPGRAPHAAGDGRPALSIVIALQEGETLAPGALDELLTQVAEAPETVQVVLADGRAQSGPWPAASHLVGVADPAARSLPRLLAVGIGAASGEWVATSEAHARFAADWVERCLELTAAGEAAALGGAVDVAPGLRPLERALYLCDYAPFMPPFPAGVSTELPGCNVVFHRHSLPPLDGPGGGQFWKSFHCRRLAAGSAGLRLDSRLLVFYGRRGRPGRLLRRRWTHGRCFGAMRAAHLSGARRWLVAVAAPVLPLVLLARLVGRLASRPGALARWLTLLPLCLLLQSTWVVGEWTGNLLGAGKSCERV